MPKYQEKPPPAPYSTEFQRWDTAVRKGDSAAAARHGAAHSARFGNAEAVEHNKIARKRDASRVTRFITRMEGNPAGMA